MSPKRHETRGTNESPSSNTSEQKIHGREGYSPNQKEQFDDDAPTFMLDVPVLKVEEIDLEVNDLRAHVSLNTELADLVKINVGVDIYLDKVKLGIKGVEAQALLTISLDRVLGTLNRALDAIDKNPQILSGVARDVNSAVGGASRGVSQVARETEQDVEKTTGTLANLQIEEEYIDDRGQIVGRARDESGHVVEGVLDEEGEVLDLVEPEEDEDRENDEVNATDAARRKANELDVKLFNVRGTGSGGRILVKDVERAAKAPADSAQDQHPTPKSH